MKLLRMCLHCLIRKANKSRGLCYSCYFRPGVRGLYPITSQFAPRNVGLHCLGIGCPTAAVPGSQAKLDVMQQRAKDNVAITHPDDLREDLMPPPKSQRIFRVLLDEKPLPY